MIKLGVKDSGAMTRVFREKNLLMPLFEALYFPTVTLGRPTLEIERLWLRLKLGGEGLPHLTACISLTVQFLRLRCRATLVGQSQYFDHKLVAPNLDVQPIPHRHRLGWLDAHLIEVNPAILNSIGCQGARFEKTRCPQPFINPNPVVTLVCVHLNIIIMSCHFNSG